MKISFPLFFFIIFIFIFLGSPAVAELKIYQFPSSDQTAQIESDRQKVIVILKESRDIEQARAAGRLKDKVGRKQQRKRVATLQAQVIDKIDTSKMKMVNRFSFTPAFSATITAEGIEQLEALEDVVAVEPDLIVHAHTTQGLGVMNSGVVQPAYSGSGVSIAVIDTGIDYTHPALGDGGFPNDKVIGGYDFGDGDASPMDSNGHGTSCAGIAAGDPVTSGSYGQYAGGVAPGAKLYALKIVEGGSSEATSSTIISAIEWCIDHQNDNGDYPIKVINISFGGGEYTSPCDTDNWGRTTALAATATNALSAGITIFASSGNSGYCDAIASPACVSDIVSVGAVFDADIGGVGFCVDPSSCADNTESYQGCSTGTVAWSYSTRADKVVPYTNMSGDLDILAPSHNAATADLDGSYDLDFGGTSAASPYAAGVAAVMQSAVMTTHGYFLTPAQVKTKMIEAGDAVAYSAAGITTPRVNLGNTDIDGDGLPSEWEILYMGTIENGAGTDIDEDGLTQLEEYNNQTDPTAADTDEDGMPDGWEVDNTLDPLTDDSTLDLDDDTYTNVQEYLAGTDPADGSDHPIPVSAGNSPFLFLSFLILLGIGGKLTMCRHKKPMGV
nr:S8 family serine peptidase [uncultured Desulfobacter sp.]